MSGTRFAIFPQACEGWGVPDVVTLSPRAGTVGPGPADAGLRAVLPAHKPHPYDPPAYLPPYTGPQRAVARPDRAGNFDHIGVEDPAFLPAHMYACVRHTLDAWEPYLGHRVVWWHAQAFPQMELVALTDWDNAQSGMGFIEAGHRANGAGLEQLFCLNFDVIGHETGHAILFAELGAPAPERLTGQFLALHESFSDLVALVAALHFRTVRERLLEQTGGDLYGLNMLNRIGELSDSEQIRIADNTTSMSEVAVLRLGRDGEWVDPTGQGRNAHALAQPLTGAMFDVFAEVFRERMAALGALPRVLGRRWSRVEAEAGLAGGLGAGSGWAFDAALCHARDVLGACMAAAMRSLTPEEASFGAVARVVMTAAARLGHAGLVDEIRDIFAVRGIVPLPGASGRAGRGWALLPYAEKRRRVAHAQLPGRGCACPEHLLVFANRLIRHPDRRRGGPLRASRV